MIDLAHRNHPAYWAFLAHRLSGVVLALFLPAHFLVLGLALKREVLDGFLHWSEQPLVRLSEAALVATLAVHIGCGLRILAIEFLPWSERQGPRIALAFAFSAVMGLLFLFQALR